MLKRGFKAMLAEANAVIETVLVDVRDQAERERDGAIPDSVHVSRGLLEFKADPESPLYAPALRPERHIILYCGTGGRSALAAKTLHDLGYSDVASLAGVHAALRDAPDRPCPSVPALE